MKGHRARIRNSHFQMFFKIDVLKKFVNLTVNNLSCNFIKKRLRHRCFNKNIVKFLRTDSFIEHLYKSKRKEKEKIFLKTTILKNIWERLFLELYLFKQSFGDWLMRSRDYIVPLFRSSHGKVVLKNKYFDN